MQSSGYFVKIYRFGFIFAFSQRKNCSRVVQYVVVSSDQVFLSENLEIYHLALPLCIQVKEITRNMAGKRVEEITNKVMMIN